MNIYDMYKRALKYGEFSNQHWHVLHGLESVVGPIRSIQSLVGKDYRVYAVGGILEDRETRDLDIILTGPMNADRINFLLKEIVLLGFSNKIWIDVKYSVSGELFIPSLYNIGVGKKSFLWASYQPEITIDGKTYKYGHLEQGLWQSMQNLPLTKGYSPQDPILLNETFSQSTI